MGSSLTKVDLGIHNFYGVDLHGATIGFSAIIIVCIGIVLLCCCIASKRCRQQIFQGSGRRTRGIELQQIRNRLAIMPPDTCHQAFQQQMPYQGFRLPSSYAAVMFQIPMTAGSPPYQAISCHPSTRPKLYQEQGATIEEIKEPDAGVKHERRRTNQTIV